MRVKCIRLINAATGQPEGRSSWLTVGQEYAVLAIDIAPGHATALRLIGDDGVTPTLNDAVQFVTVSTTIPPIWRARVEPEGHMDIAPALWLRPGFWEDYFNGLSEAIAEFESERAAILAGSG